MNTTRLRASTALVSALAVGLLGAGGLLAAGPSASAASLADPVAVAQAERDGCQAWLTAHPGATTAQATRMRNCVTDETAIIAALSAPSPTPSGSPSTSPSASPTVTATATTAPPSTTPPASPTPSVTPTGPVLNDCMPVPSRCGFPDATNTGARGTLTVVTGDVVLTTAGQVYEGKDVRGCITVRASNVFIRNVKVLCGKDFTAAIDHEAGALLTVEDVTLSCNQHGQSATGVWGDHTRVARADISACENGFDIYNDWVVRDSWVHDLYDGGSAHTDGAQVTATGATGGGIQFLHNTFNVHGVTTSAIEADHCACTGLVVSGNLFSGRLPGEVSSGPAYPIYCPQAAPGPSVGVTVTNNRFGLLGQVVNNKRQPPYGYDSNCGAYTWSGNVADATGAAIAP